MKFRKEKPGKYHWMSCWNPLKEWRLNEECEVQWGGVEGRRLVRG
jgi:hypothetical protein